MNLNNVALFGLGKLGLPLALILSQYYKLYGIDVDKNKIDNLKKGVSPFFETGMDDYLKNNIENITFCEIDGYDINNFDIAVILVNTPSDIKGEFSNQYIHDVIRDLSKKLKDSNKKDFLFILSSTVMPGSHVEIISEIETLSGKKLNDDFGFVYIPDLVALGNVIYDFENPDLVIIGESNEKYGKIALEIYSKFIKNNAPHVNMELIESEICKVSLNAYITMKISFANFIGNISEKYNCNPNNITKALGYDKRISPYYIKSGLPFGGTCFPRDTWAFIKMSEKLGLDAIHIKATQKINELQHDLLFNKVQKYIDKKIGIFGISFKPKTSVTVESSGYILYEKLKKLNYSVFGCDEIVEVEFNYDSIEEFIQNCDVIVLTHNDSKILEKFKEKFKEKILINPWKIDI
jgi:UDPglucose 6-dehydrogenase